MKEGVVVSKAKNEYGWERKAACIMEEVDWKGRGNYSEIVEHRKDFYSLLMGKRAKTLQHTLNYVAVVFLLTADEELWEVVHRNDSTVLAVNISCSKAGRKENKKCELCSRKGTGISACSFPAGWDGNKCFLLL